MSGDLQPLQWLCQQCGGVFVKNPAPQSPSAEAWLAENELVEVSGDFLKSVAAYLKPGGRTPEQATELRQCLEELKACGEGFVQACERGSFRLVVMV